MEELYINGQKIKPVENAECVMYFGYKAAVLTINDLKFDILIKEDDLKKIKDVYNLNNIKTKKPNVSDKFDTDIFEIIDVIED